MYNFDIAADRKKTQCYKWDFMPCSTQYSDFLPMSIADMDFKTADPIINSLKKKLNSDVVFGYGTLSENYYATVMKWLKKRHNYEVERDWIVTIPGVVTALCISVQILTEVGDEVIIPTPVYTPFYRAVTDFGRKAVSSSLKLENNQMTFDFDDIKSKITPKTKAIMLCSPHNPTGRVWDREELTQLAEICKEHNLYVIDDEIHNDLVYKKEHIVFGNISEDAAMRSIICTAPSKTFNIAGIPDSNIIIKNEKIRNDFKSMIAKTHISVCSAIAEPAVCAAYNECEEWLDELLQYIDGNMDYFNERIANEIPDLKFSKPDGTYLAWVDFRGVGKTSDEIKEILIDKCHLVLNNGKDYGPEGDGFFRVNLACPRSYVEEAVNRLKNAFSK